MTATRKRVVAAYVARNDDGVVTAIAKRDRVYVDRDPNSGRRRKCVRFVVHVRGDKREAARYAYGADRAYGAVRALTAEARRPRRLLRDADRDRTPVLPMEGLPDGL